MNRKRNIGVYLAVGILLFALGPPSDVLANGVSANGIYVSGGSGNVTVANGATIDGAAYTTAGIRISGSAGTHTFGSVGNPSAIGGATPIPGEPIGVTTGSATVNYTGTITNTSGRAVSVSDTTGGTISCSGTVTDSGTGILVDGADGNVTITGADLNGSSGIEILGDATNDANGSFTFNNVTVDVSGDGFKVDGGAANDVSATIDLNNVDITNPGGRVANVNDLAGGSVDFDSASALSTNTGTGILVDGCGGGTVTFGGSTKTLNTGANTPVTLSSNTGATVNFNGGGLDIDTTSGTGFVASGGGTVNVSGSNNTVATTTGAGAVISGMTFGGSNVSFDSIGAGGGLDFDGNTGTFTSGGGTVTASSGSTVTVDGGSATYNLNNMTISRTGGRVLTVGGTTAAGGTINFGGTSALTASGGDYGVRVDGSSAGVTIATLNITSPVASIAGTYNPTTGRPTNDGNGDGVFLKNNTGSFTVNGGTFASIADNAFDVRNSNNTVVNGVMITSTGNSGIQWYQGSSLSFLNSTMIPGNNAVVSTGGVNIQDSGIRALDVGGNLILGNGSTIGPFPGYVFANAVSGSEDRAVELDNDTGTNMNVTVTGCTFTGADFQGLNLRHIGGSLDAVIGGPNIADGNTFVNINGAAIDTGPSQESPTGNVHGLLVQKNDFDDVGIAISVFSGRGNSLSGNQGTHATIRDNDVDGTTSDAMRLAGFGSGTQGSPAQFKALVENNTIVNVAANLDGSGGGSAFFVAAEDSTNAQVKINNHTTVQGGAPGASNSQSPITTQVQRAGDLDLILTNNTFSNMPGIGNGFGAWFSNGAGAPSSHTVQFGGNNWGSLVGGFGDTFLIDADSGVNGSTFALNGYMGGGTDSAALVAYINTIDSNAVNGGGFTIFTGAVTNGSPSVAAPNLPPLTP